MCIRDRHAEWHHPGTFAGLLLLSGSFFMDEFDSHESGFVPVSYTHLRAHETVLDLVCRLLLEKKNHHEHVISQSF